MNYQSSKTKFIKPYSRQLTTISTTKPTRMENGAHKLISV